MEQQEIIKIGNIKLLNPIKKKVPFHSKPANIISVAAFTGAMLAIIVSSYIPVVLVPLL